MIVLTVSCFGKGFFKYFSSFTRQGEAGLFDVNYKANIHFNF